MQIGTYFDGRPITFDSTAGVFRIGEVPVTAEQVRENMEVGRVTWATPEIAAWFDSTLRAPHPPAPPKSDGKVVLVVVVAAVVLLAVFACGIFSAIATPAFRAAKTNAQQKACYANERVIEGAAQSALAESGALPASMEAMVPTYITAVPTCLGGGTYTYDPNSGKVTCSVHGHY